jgi:molybdate transport system substrate-binding protein
MQIMQKVYAGTKHKINFTPVKNIIVRSKKAILFLFSMVLLLSCNTNPEKEKLHIAVSANMQFAMKELTAAYTSKTGVGCQLIISSSGKLTAQIKEGAPYDLFVSADMKYPEDLYKAGFTYDKPEVYAFGRLVMWTLQENIRLFPDTLLSTTIKHIALPNPRTAPYGSAAVRYLQKQRIYEAISNKLVYGESVAQTNQFIFSGSAEIGFTAKSVVLSPAIAGKGSWIDIPQVDHEPIAQGIVVIKNKKQVKDKALAFRDFIFSEESKLILEKYGYIIKDTEQ